MSWDVVASGDLSDDGRYVIERRVIYLSVPTSASTLPIRLRSYRRRVIRADGTSKVTAKARSRAELDAAP